MDSKNESPRKRIDELSSERLTVLFSPFRSKLLNPEHYEEKLKFWTSAVEEYVTSTGNSLFTLQTLLTFFSEPHGKKPACLPQVLYAMVDEGTVKHYEQFVASLTPVSWIYWPVGTLKWVFNQIISYTPLLQYYVPSKKNLVIDSETILIHLSQFAKNEAKLCESLSFQNKLMSLDDFTSEALATLSISKNELNLLIDSLKIKSKLYTDHIGHTEVVKLGDETSKSKGISQVEKSQFDIERTIEVLECELGELVKKQEQSHNMARAALKEGKRSIAKHHLRAKKTAEGRVKKISEMLDNLSAISHQIESSASDILILKAYEAGKNALSKQLKDNNLNADRVTESMLDIQEVLDEYNEASESLSNPISDEDVSEIENELAELLNIDSPKTEPIGLTDEDLKHLKDIEMMDLDDLSTSEPTKSSKSKEKA